MFSEGLEKNNFFLSSCFLILVLLSTLFTESVSVEGAVFGLSAMIINVRLYMILFSNLFRMEKRNLLVILLVVLIKVPFLFFQVFMLSNRSTGYVLSALMGVLSVVGAGIIEAVKDR